jgi:dolichyl-phosphate beta-glucosyltransferase
MISLVIPVYNYAHGIAETQKRLKQWIQSRSDVLEIIFVDDGSADGTADALRSLEAPMRSIRLDTNHGKGAAVRAGMLASKGDYVFFTDVDLPYELSAIDRALEAFKNGANVVLGSRYAAGSSFKVQRSFKRRIASFVFTFLTNLILIKRVADTQCGLKAFRKGIINPLFEPLKSFGYVFDVELIYHSQRNEYRIATIPLELVEESTSSVHLMRDGISMTLGLVRLYVKTRSPLFTRHDAVLALGIGITIAFLALPLIVNLGFFPEHGRGLFLAVLFIAVPSSLMLGAYGLTLLPIPPQSASQLSRYATVGFFNASLNAAIFNSLMYVTGISSGFMVTVFAVITFAIIITQAFFWSVFWTFRSVPPQNRIRQYLLFLAVSSTTALVNIGIIHVLVNVIGAPAGISPQLWANLALLFTIVTAVLGNFFGYKFLVFTARP